MWSEFEKSAGIVDFVSISISFTCLVCALKSISGNAFVNAAEAWCNSHARDGQP